MSTDPKAPQPIPAKAPVNKPSAPKHTPAPWAFRYFGNEELFLVADHGHRAVILGGSRGAKPGLVTKGDDGVLTRLKPEDPNARLIESAPELLGALKRCVSALSANGAPNCEAAKEGHAAIAKAEGQS